METDVTCHPCSLRGHSYLVTVQVMEGEQLLVQVEDRASADQWRATFDSQYIENLTAKTRNFKEFQVFVSMLQTAVEQSSDSVSLDLLTYSDLEALRKHKPGTPNTKSNSSLNTKRYLILLYTAEFDKIHYPLPLNYMGPPDPSILQDTVQKLREEIKLLKKQTQAQQKNTEVHKLQKELKLLQHEKVSQETSLVEFTEAMKHSSDGRAVKEVRLLKGIIKNLEEELLKEKTRYQRATTRQNKDYQKLLTEVEELRVSDRNLRVRVKSLTNENAMLKRQNAVPRRANTSRDRSYDRSAFSFSRDRSTSSTRNSRDRLPPLNRASSRDRLTARSDSRDRLTGRSDSRDRTTTCDRLAARSNSRERPISAPTARSRVSHDWKQSPCRRSRTPSPGMNRPRFDPTAYVRDKERRKEESNIAKQRTRIYNSAERRSKLTSRANSNERKNTTNRSRLSSAGSRGYSSDDAYSDSSYTGLQIKKRKGKVKPRLRATNVYLTSPEVSQNSRNCSGDTSEQNLVSSTPNTRVTAKTKPPSSQQKVPKENGIESDFYDRSSEICDIDARLERLQKMMKTTLQCTT